jgi:type IV pilus assembly protein PilW
VNHSIRANSGFSLVELMIALVLGLVISGAVIQVMVSTSVTERLNRSVASVQENGRFIITRLRREILMTGRYDPLSVQLDLAVDTVEEGSFVQNHPVILPNDFTLQPALGAIQGSNGANDTLVVGLQASTDCRGNSLGYAPGTEFYVINQYFVDGNQLKCRGYDGRVVRGKIPANVDVDNTAVTLLDDVYSFQVLYGITNHGVNGDYSAKPVRYATADELAAEIANNSQVVAVRIALFLKGEGAVKVAIKPRVKLLNEQSIVASEEGLFKQFETTVTLRNMKNFMRNRKL